MTRYLLRKRIFAVVFLVTIFCFSILNFVHSYEPLKEKLIEIVNAKEEFSVKRVVELETTITDNLYGRMNYIEAYGYIQKLLDKREFNNFNSIKDEYGYLQYASFYREEDTRLFEYSMRIKRLQDYVKTSDTKVLFVVPPGKYDKNETKLRIGMPINDPNWIVDEMMFYLNRLGVETLDLRQSIPNEELSYEEAFFKTDHHWTIPAAFYATCEVVDKINDSFGENLDPQGYYTDIKNYDIVTYRSGMLGSMGRKTGANFCGIEDFTALWPRFEGDYTRESMMQGGQSNKKQGSFIEVLMESSVLTDKTDIYSDSQYSLYLNGLRIYEKIVNEENPEGSKIFMIRDSYFSPVISFLMPMCGQIDAIWSLEDTRELDIESYVKENEFDYIIIEVYPYNINSSAFNFFKED